MDPDPNRNRQSAGQQPTGKPHQLGDQGGEFGPGDGRLVGRKHRSDPVDPVLHVSPAIIFRQLGQGGRLSPLPGAAEDAVQFHGVVQVPSPVVEHVPKNKWNIIERAIRAFLEVPP